MGKVLSIQENVKESAKKILKESAFREGKSDADTVRLWENYREQALLWRALALIQVPSTLLAIIFAFVIWLNSETILNVPARPLPGFYDVSEIQDAEFVSFATEFINLIATYSPDTARRQFDEATKYLVEPMVTRYATEMKQQELQAIENTRRTQIYYIDPTKTEIQRHEEDSTVDVYFEGERQKLIAGKATSDLVTQFIVRMKTIPRSALNEYGIVIYSVESTNTKQLE